MTLGWLRLLPWKRLGLLFGGLLTYAFYALDIRDRVFPHHELTPEIAVKLETTARQAHAAQPQPGPARDVALVAAVERVAEAERVNLDEARAIATRASQRMELANESVVRGLEMARRGDYESARREFQSASKVDPGSAGAWSNLAAASSLVGRYEEARAAYDRALLIDPDDWRIRYNFGLLFARNGRPDEALRQLRPALAALRSAGVRSELARVIDELENDPGLDGLRSLPGYPTLVSY